MDAPDFPLERVATGRLGGGWGRAPVPVQLHVEGLVPGGEAVGAEQVGPRHWHLGLHVTRLLHHHLEDAVLGEEALADVDDGVGEAHVAVVVLHRGAQVGIKRHKVP